LAHDCVPNFDHLELLPLRFVMTARQGLHLPAYMGSILRGAFGHALKKTVCAFDLDTPCSTCMLREVCTYTAVFEPQISSPAGFPTLQTPPRPFVLRPPQLDDYRLKPGDDLSFEFNLVGSAVKHLPYIVTALRRMGSDGFGPGRARFDLAEIRVVDEEGHTKAVIYRKGDNTIVMPGAQTFLRGGELRRLARSQERPSSETMTIRFKTMTRLKQKGYLRGSAPPFEVLIRHLLFRLSAMSALYQEQTVAAPWKDLLALAEAVTPLESNVAWQDWQRYSSRQKTTMALGGLVGTVTYRGPWQPFLQVLALGEHLHVGKGATFGLGQYELVD